MELKVLGACAGLVAMSVGVAELADTSGKTREPLTEAKSWTATDEDAWSWAENGDSPVLRLERQSDYSPPVRSPFNLIWFDAARFESFELTVEARLTAFNEGNNDLCIAFGGDGPQRFYYAHLGESADSVHHQIHLVDEADRRPVTGWRSEGTPWQEGGWHEIRLTRDAASGRIEVRFDGEKVLEAEDRTLTKGRVGLGSFDDTGEFRNLVLRPLEEESGGSEKP